MKLNQNLLCVINLSLIITVINCKKLSEHNLNHSLDPLSDTYSNQENPLCQSTSKQLIINDFNHGAFNQPNLWGVFDNQGRGFNNGIIECYYEPGTAYTEEEAFVFKIAFNFSQTQSAASWAQDLADRSKPDSAFLNVQAIGFKYLTFNLRGKTGNELFEIGMGDEEIRPEPKISISEILDGASVGTDWRRVKIDLDNFTTNENNEQLDFTNLMYIGFFFKNSLTAKGTIYIDNISFSW